MVGGVTGGSGQVRKVKFGAPRNGTVGTDGGSRSRPRKKQSCRLLFRTNQLTSFQETKDATKRTFYSCALFCLIASNLDKLLFLVFVSRVVRGAENRRHHRLQ